MQERQSNIELLRILSMFMIVLYHTYSYSYIDNELPSVFAKSLQMPMHSGVIVFILISGYFGIRFSFKGLLNLLSRVYVLAVPLAVLGLVMGINNNLLDSILIIGTNKYWFVNTYLQLFCIAPLINKGFEQLSNRERIILLLSLAIISFYIGDIKMSDPALSNGKNLLNFIFIYLVGRIIRTSVVLHPSFQRFGGGKIVLFIAAINSAVILSYNFCDIRFVQDRIWALCFPYCSPILIFNGILIFLLFYKINIRSKFVNTLSASMFAVYILHGAKFPWLNFIAKLKDLGIADLSPLKALTISIFLTIIIMLICIAVDKLLSPVWRNAKEYGRILDKKLS